MFIIAASRVKALHQESMCGFGIDAQFPPVQAQEYVGRKEGNTLIAVNEGVVDDEGFEHGGRHLAEMIVIAGLRAKQGALQ